MKKKSSAKLNVGLYLLLALMNSLLLFDDHREIQSKYGEAKQNYVRKPSSGIQEDIFVCGFFFF